MMRNFKLLYIPIILLVLSCDGNSAFREFERFQDNRWMRTDVQTYDITIDKAGKYDLVVDFSHVYGAPIPAIPLEITIKSPDNQTSTEKAVILMSNAEGDALSDCTGDICDLEQIIFEGRTFAPGKYTINLSQHFDHEYLPNVIGVGIRLKNAEGN